jgi:hypothetical protein
LLGAILYPPLIAGGGHSVARAPAEPESTLQPRAGGIFNDETLDKVEGNSGDIHVTK